MEEYARGLAWCRNFIITPHGSAVNRPGTLYLGAVKDSSKHVRLVPFVYSETESYLLEFGDSYIRVWSQGIRLAAVEVTTTYLEAELPRLKFSQVGGVLNITHPAHAPAELKLSGDASLLASWALLDVAFSRPAAFFPGQPSLDNSPPTGLPVADASHPVREWVWKLTTLLQDEQGRVIESLPYTVTQTVDKATHPTTFDYTPLASNYFAVYSDKAVAVDWTQPPAGLTGVPAGYTAVGYRVYRGRGQTWGYIGETTDTRFIDIGAAPDITQQPPAARNPFSVRDHANSVIRTENPAVVVYHQQRRVYANSWYGGSNFRPHFVWASATGDFTDFDIPFPPVASTAFELELASKRREEIRSLVGVDQLLALTNAGVWTLEGPGGDALSAAELNSAQVHSEVGASWLDPLLVGDAVLYARARGPGVQELTYNFQRQRYLSNDVSVTGKHLLLGHQVVDWCFAREPYAVVWAVRDDGVLLSLTYAPERKTLAWARHDTGNGTDTVESVACVPEGDEDAVYLVVRRSINGAFVRYLERFASRTLPTILLAHGEEDLDATRAVFLDCSSTLDGGGVLTWTTLTALEHLEGQAVTVLGDGVVYGPFTVASGAVTLPEAVGYAIVGLAYTSELELLDVGSAQAEVRSNQKLVREVTWEVEASRGLWVGETFAKLNEWRQRQVSDSYGPVAAALTDRAKVLIAATWNTGGRAVLRQVDPLPLTVLGVTREVVFGGV